MSKRKLLLVTQELDPYTALTEIAQIANQLPLSMASQAEIRILMPRFGVVNERRHRLHEVVRLSGMNIIVNDEDFPLLIKVASLPGSRIQVYFLDNEEFFKRRAVFEDEEGKPFDDNLERSVFFCKSVVEIVKKFGWAPDIIHCQGWMTGLLPLYLRAAYRTEPLFAQTKIVYSLYDTLHQTFTQSDFALKASINNLTADDLTPYYAADSDLVDIHKGAAFFADGIVKGSETNSQTVMDLLEQTDKPVLENANVKEGGYPPFYTMLETAEVVS
ncbi:MAG: hypothetical protein RL757_1926 [Bacteroidota bacterium]|jgi:starch synthase